MLYGHTTARLHFGVQLDLIRYNNIIVPPRAICLRCLPLLLDSSLLPDRSVLLNMYQGFLLAGMKFLAYITALPQWRGRSKGRGKDCYKPRRLERSLVLYFFSEFPIVYSCCQCSSHLATTYRSEVFFLALRRLKLATSYSEVYRRHDQIEDYKSIVM